MRRDWTAAWKKMDEEGCCRVCGRVTEFLDAAHIVPRRFDKVVAGPRGGKVRYVEPNNIIPLCGAIHGNKSCHRAFDSHELDISERLTEEEKQHVISVLGEGRAMRRITGDRDMLEACWSGLERADD